MQSRLDLETWRTVTVRLRQPGHRGQLQPPGELGQGTVALPGIVVQLNTLQRRGEHGLATQRPQRVVL